MIKHIIILLLVFNVHKSESIKSQDITSEMDTSEVCFSCLMDTGRNLFLYSFSYPDQVNTAVDCVIKRGEKYSDTGFFLELNDILSLDRGLFVNEFWLYSRYFKRVHLIYLKKDEKKLFKGFRFKTFRRKILHAKNKTQFIDGYMWPYLNKLDYPYNKRKHLNTLTKGYILRDVKILD